jgi:hypothetical protein
MSAANGAMRAALDCVTGNSASIALGNQSDEQLALARTATTVDGRNFVLDAGASPIAYVEDPSVPLQASHFRFALYRANTEITLPLELIGFLEIGRGAGGMMTVHADVEGTVLDYTGLGNVTFRVPGDRGSPKTAHELSGTGTCTRAGSTVQLEFADSYSAAYFSTLPDFVRFGHDAKMTTPFGVVAFEGGAYVDYVHADSDRGALLRLTLPKNLWTVDFSGSIGALKIDSIILDGDSNSLTEGNCLDPGTGFSRICLKFHDQAIDSAVALEFHDRIRKISDWTSSGVPPALPVPLEVAITAPIG